MSRFEAAVVTDASQSGVRIRKRDCGASSKLARRAARVIRRFRGGPQVVRDYRAAAPELTSSDNWTRLYGQ